MRPIDVAIPGDSRLTQKVVEKQTKYMDLRIEITRVWNCRRVFAIQIVVGALGSISKDLPSYFAAAIFVNSEIPAVYPIFNHITTASLFTCLIYFCMDLLLAHCCSYNLSSWLELGFFFQYVCCTIYAYNTVLIKYNNTLSTI